MIERLVSAGSGRVARLRFTDRHDGDFRVDDPDASLEARRQSVAGHPWTWLRQVHGAEIVEVREPGAGAGTEADASVTPCLEAVLAVQTADCAPVVLIGDGAVAIAHVGWRGLLAGVIEAAVDALRGRGTGPIRAVVGPTIRPRNYEFGEAELSEVAAAVGPVVRSTTRDGRPALDLAAAAGALLRQVGVGDLTDLGLDTAAPDYFSHRCRGDHGRQATTVHLERS